MAPSSTKADIHGVSVSTELDMCSVKLLGGREGGGGQVPQLDLLTTVVSDHMYLKIVYLLLGPFCQLFCLMKA